MLQAAENLGTCGTSAVEILRRCAPQNDWDGGEESDLGRAKALRLRGVCSARRLARQQILYR